jgi:CBS domain-containing protein
MTISDVLRNKGRQVIKATTTDPVRTVVRILRDNDIGAVLVADPWMRPAGVFSERDLTRAIAVRGPSMLDQPVGDHMSTPVVSCRPTDRIDAVLAMMTLGRMRHVPVMKDDTLLGMVSIGDLVKYRLDEKELETGVLLDIVRMHA